MNFLWRSLFVVSFFLLVGGEWADWNMDHRDCLKKRFESYVEGMENIFAPNNSLKEKSLIKKFKRVHDGTIMSLPAFLAVMGDYVLNCGRSLNHEFVTSNKESLKKARGVIYRLCTSIKELCPDVSKPIALSTELHEIFIDVLRGEESKFVNKCGTYDKDAAPSLYNEYYKSEIKPGMKPSTSASTSAITSTSRGSSRNSSGFSRLFSSGSSRSSRSSANETD